MTLPKHADWTLEMTPGVARGTPKKVLTARTVVPEMIQDYPRSDYRMKTLKNAMMWALHWNG